MQPAPDLLAAQPLDDLGLGRPLARPADRRQHRVGDALRPLPKLRELRRRLDRPQPLQHAGGIDEPRARRAAPPAPPARPPAGTPARCRSAPRPRRSRPDARPPASPRRSCSRPRCRSRASRTAAPRGRTPPCGGRHSRPGPAAPWHRSAPAGSGCGRSRPSPRRTGSCSRPSGSGCCASRSRAARRCRLPPSAGRAGPRRTAPWRGPKSPKSRPTVPLLSFAGLSRTPQPAATGRRGPADPRMTRPGPRPTMPRR